MFYKHFIATIGPPTLQKFSTAYYVIAGDPFILNCTATNDPQSPNELRFRWFNESTRIDNKPTQWNITELSMRNTLTVTSQVVITHLTVEQHNGTYVCSVDNSKGILDVVETTTIIVESEYCFRFSLLMLIFSYSSYHYFYPSSFNNLCIQWFECYSIV